MSMTARRYSLSEIRQLAMDALVGAGAALRVAEVVSQSIVDAEAEGIRMIGLDYLSVYCRHLMIGKVDGCAEPVISRAGPSALRVDARNGFCHSGYVAAEPEFYELARTQTIAALALRNSYASGVIGWFCDRMARSGLVGLTFTNASPTMAPHGGRLPVFGTNPVALGVPRSSGAPLVIDVSPAATTRLEVKRRLAEGKPIPEGWGLDAYGQPCTDPGVVLREGTVAPVGGHKGSALAMIVEIMAAALTGANWSFEAADLGNEEGGPPGIGQFFIAMDPVKLGGDGYANRIETMIDRMLEQDGVRLPGDRRNAFRAVAETEGIEVPDTLIATIREFAGKEGLA